MKIVSFSLYGSSPRYTLNALINAKLMKNIYDKWIMYVYYDNTVPINIINELKKYPYVKLQNMTNTNIKNKMLWRFLPIFNNNIERYIIRDIDSHISMRERNAVDEWIKSDKLFHIMRDHPSHTKYSMSGGMWGGVHIKNLNINILNRYNKPLYLLDMKFLHNELWPIIHKSVLQHDSFPNNKFGKTCYFPTKRINYEHVGSVIINNKMRKCDVDILKNYIINNPKKYIISNINKVNKVNKYKIGMLLISTSNGRDWKTMKDTYLLNIFTKSFLKSIDKENEYVVYIGIDKGDPILDNKEEQKIIERFSLVFKNVSFKFITFDETVKKGHVSKMWNVVHQIAYDEDCHYFYQCGDDINFKTHNWVNDSIKTLQEHDNIGLTGPINNNNRILTQSFVSRTHMNIFNYYFPEELINWGIDDWYNYVYQPNHFYPLKNHFCSNDGGNPRYDVDGDPTFFNNYQKNVKELRIKAYQLAQKHKILITNYINNKNII